MWHVQQTWRQLRQTDGLGAFEAAQIGQAEMHHTSHGRPFRGHTHAHAAPTPATERNIQVLVLQIPTYLYALYYIHLGTVHMRVHMHMQGDLGKHCG